MNINILLLFSCVQGGAKEVLVPLQPFFFQHASLIYFLTSYPPPPKFFFCHTSLTYPPACPHTLLGFSRIPDFENGWYPITLELELLAYLNFWKFQFLPNARDFFRHFLMFSQHTQYALFHRLKQGNYNPFCLTILWHFLFIIHMLINLSW